MALGRAYIIQVDSLAMADNGAMVHITGPTDAVTVIDKITVTQETQTSSEANAILVTRASAAGTGGGTSTVSPTEVGSPAYGGTVIDDKTPWTVQPTLTTTLLREGWNVLAPFIWHPTPEERIVISPSGQLVVNLENTPGASMTFSINIAIREIGG